MLVYTIRVKGHLDQSWSEWFDGMMITNEANGDTAISGSVTDQAALHSLLVTWFRPGCICPLMDSSVARKAR